MKPELIEFIDNARKRKVEKFRHQLSVFLICLAISLFLWILVRLSREYNITLKYQTEYTGIPSGLRLRGSSDSTLDVSMRIQGFEYFSERYFKKEKHKLEINLKNIRIRQSEDKIKGFILTKNLLRTISEQTSYSSEVLTISPDTLFFSFERKNTIRKLSPAETRTIEIKPSSDTGKHRRDSLLLIRNKPSPRKK